MRWKGSWLEELRKKNANKDWYNLCFKFKNLNENQFEQKKYQHGIYLVKTHYIWKFKRNWEMNFEISWSWSFDQDAYDVSLTY